MRYIGCSVIYLAALLLHCNAFAERLAIPLTEQAVIEAADEGAQILYSLETVDVDSDYNWQSTHYYSIRINDLQAARDYGRITIGYNHYYSSVELEFANVLTPTGDIKAVKADALQQRTSGSQDFYEDRTELVFSLPEIAPGSIMEFQYRKKSIRLPMPGLFSSSSSAFWYQPTVGGNGARIDPVHRAQFEVTVPKALAFEQKRLGPVKPQYSKNAEGGRISHRWQWQNLAAVAVEASMPPIDEVMPRVRVSSSVDWADVDRWTWQLAKDKFSRDQQIKMIADNLVAKNASREDKIKAVYAYLQENVRYVFAHLGRGGYEPHPAAEVVQQRYGDCKDQTVLAIALLRELGVEAYPSLVVTQRNGQPDMELVALYFDHMMVWIPGHKKQQSMWMDTTADRALFPGVSNYLLGQAAFIVDGKGGRLTTIGDQLPANIGKLSMNYYVDDNKHMIVDVTAESSGIYEQNLRNWWIHDSNRETSLQQIMGTIFPDGKSKAKITSQVLNDDNLWQPFTIKTQFDFGPAHEEQGAPLTMGVGVIQAYRLFGDINALQIPEERKHRWVSNQPETMEIHARMSGDTGELPAVVSSGVDRVDKFFTIEQSGQQIDNSYKIAIKMQQPALDLTVPEYAEYVTALNNITSAGHWLVSFMQDKNQLELADMVAHANSNDVQSQLKLARYYIDKGQFDKALEPAIQAVDLDDANGEAWYLLGVVQGYNAMVEESMDSFAHATNLGYTP